MDTIYVKPLATGAIAAALDKWALGQPDMKKSLYFGVAVAAGTGVATVASPMLPNLIPVDLGSAADGKTLTGRVAEVALGSGAAWGVNKYILKNEIAREDWMKRAGVIALAGFGGEYVADYMAGNPLSWAR
jgi:hypothetical protein